MPDPGRPGNDRAPKPGCDGRYRCFACEGGVGRDGRGYANAQSVPCCNPSHEDHMYTYRECICPSLISSAREFYATEEEYTRVKCNLEQARPGPRGWCHECARERKDPPAAPVSRKRRREETVAKQRERRRERAVAGRPLEAHIGPCGDPEGGAERGARGRLAQLPWCGSGLYRCARCYPPGKVGQTRAVPAKACTDPRAHMPRGYADRECVHYLPTGAAASELPADTLEQLRVLAREHGCERCRAAANE